MTYRVMWKSKLTGAQGNGVTFRETDRTVLQAWIDQMNAAYPHFWHWMDTWKTEEANEE